MNVVAPLAQLDRASVYGTEGCAFEPRGVRFRRLIRFLFNCCTANELRSELTRWYWSEPVRPAVVADYRAALSRFSPFVLRHSLV